MKSGFILFIILIILGSQSRVSAQAPGLDTFHLADPTIFHSGKKYYLYGTGDQGPGGFKVYISDDLKNWKLSEKNDGYALKKGESYGDKGFWAPQVFAWHNKFYMAYAANEQIAIAEGDNPAGPFTQKSLQPLAADVKQIDPFVYFENGKVYLYHVRLTNGNRIFVAELNDDLTAIKENTLKECISSSLPWENTANATWPVAEGPSVLKRDGLYYLFYSSNDFRNPDYAVGYATSKTPMGPWLKFEGNPVIDRKMVGINGPGHGDFFTDNGGQLNYVLHAHNSSSKVSPRNTALIKIAVGKGKISVDRSSFHFIGLRRQGVQWDSSTLTRVSNPDSGGVYARMIQLKSGELVCVYASNGNVVATRSSDLGKTWSAAVIVSAKRNEVNMDTPDLLQLQNGNLMVCYNARPREALRGNPDSTKHFDVRVCFSRNKGVSFGEEKILYEGSPSFKDGCWEASALQLPSGQIQLYFSDESVYTRSDEQNISVLYSEDNGDTWSKQPQIISFRKGSRDGMPVAIYLAEQKKIALAIEDPGYKHFKPYIIHSGVNGKWTGVISGDDLNRKYALATRLPDTTYAGAPFLRRLSSGETVITYQSCEGRLKNHDSDAMMQVAIGSSSASDFVPAALPFPTPEGFHSLWNSLCILKDDTIVALTSTNVFSKGWSEVWMIKGRLTRY